MFAALIGIAALFLATGTAHATLDGCAVVLKTPDGFLSLRASPTTKARVGRQMKRIATIGIAALLLATGTAHGTPMTDRQKQMLYSVFIQSCVRGLPHLWLPRPPLTIEEVWNYCQCAGGMLEDLITSEEYFAFKPPDAPNESVPESVKESATEKAQCIAVEKCKKHLNLPDPSQLQYERCWKG